ncbi:hypothetical protein YPPY34_2627, partial [Yersinia pestis PY-34]
MFCGGGGP